VSDARPIGGINAGAGGYRQYVAIDTRLVRNNREARRYELFDVNGRMVGVCDYHIDGNVVVLPHTEIVPDRRGEGLGAELVQGALDDVRSSGARVRPLCWYVVEFIDEHPQYADLVAG
jgi:predicted GNAT family acetyltransferase